MPASRRQLLRLLDSLEGPISAAFLADNLNITSRATIAAMERAIAANDLEALLRAIGIRPGAWAHMTESIRQAYIDSGVFIVAADVPKRFGMTFDWTNPRAERWLREHSSQLVTRISNEQREAIREVLNAGMRAGKNPRSVALDIVGRVSRQTGKRAGGIVGLTKQQAKYVREMGEALGSSPPGWFTRPDGTRVQKFWIGDNGSLKSPYSLRDRRFDSIVRKAIAEGKPLTQPDINRIVGRYSDRLLKHRGDNIGRTEALSSLNSAHQESVKQIIDEGLAPPDAVKRVWNHSFKADRRPGHFQLNGTEVGPDEPFVNPVTGAVLMYPGDGPASERVNCACMLTTRIDFFAVANAA